MRYSIIILFFGILSAQWTGGSANLIESGRKEVGLFSPIYLGLNNGKELSINKFLFMPNIALKQERSSIGQWQMAQKLQLEYPTIGLKWLQSPLGKELGDPNMFALISPQFNVPQMISAYGELIGTRGTEKIGRVTIRGGIAFSLGGKMSEDGTIDLPIIYPRLCTFSIIAISSDFTSLAFITNTGTSCRPAFCEANHLLSPAIISNLPSCDLSGRTTIG